MTSPYYDEIRAETEEHSRRLAERAAEQLRRHEADPYNVPEFIPCDDPELPSDYTFGSPEEEDA
jgi:hypothetical protein